MWILILVFNTIAVQEFQSHETCVAAQRQLKDVGIGYSYCVKK